jgi:hypothetical protein
MKIMILAAAALVATALSAQAYHLAEVTVNVKDDPGLVGDVAATFLSLESEQTEGNGISVEASSGVARPSFAPDKGEVEKDEKTGLDHVTGEPCDAVRDCFN